MALKKKPVTGMKDMMPSEMEVRDYVISLIKDTYKTFGFSSIETPCVEHIENLCSKQGGDNEKLIFKILKRGEKLRINEAKEEADLVDGGLRYDLTVPLSRYYANHANELPAPFKALQMGNVWRADRPQRGRFRQFMQCDIDILGEPSNLAEIELILATTTLLGKLDFHNFTIRINDRRFLKAMAAYSGFKEEDYDSVFITLDKMDKIGLDGVAAELKENGYAEESVEKYLELFKEITGDVEGVRMCKEKLQGYLAPEAADGLEMIISCVEQEKEADFRMKFDPTLVRGMSYYTGTIFEISMDEFGGSVGGGGRYDKMIGKFTGQDTPAVGFSIGFERIVMLLLERGYQVPTSRPKKAYLLEKKISREKLLEVLEQAKADRAGGMQVMIMNMKKNKKFQKEQLAEQGYTDITEVYNG
ncbi:histidine--tRNA ligase [Mediterraneibacter glycyrrhizinilyticus]|uniref:histidine--tRNA ligase n=1 Tax=Mediterraneibacter glycyrrhizinilyticus TaxID=342942 RepID=UPI00196198A8|nr:histidine--tRNA ligase [Mediterraneibacter glycyrrhizinilyticus]MBM6803462.1 histidine--tRNA ligase [Mediterraneibacter glycyrrhizinilyticus]MDM8125799.1 histidine--tRNA ligase [Mediterraneibacter glycyrrhizinilyticus]MDM8210652.1 histidine--tRNA ligase [Mediterraneibacter glycyrrhizinilyticus]